MTNCAKYDKITSSLVWISHHPFLLFVNNTHLCIFDSHLTIRHSHDSLEEVRSETLICSYTLFNLFKDTFKADVSGEVGRNTLLRVFKFFHVIGIEVRLRLTYVLLQFFLCMFGLYFFTSLLFSS